MKTASDSGRKDLIRQCENVASLLKELAHPQRLAILCHLSDSERTVSELESMCDASQSLISQFLARMKAEGLVKSRRDGKYVSYRIADEHVVKLIQALQKIFCP